MKRIYFALFLFAFSFTINAQVQNLYAMSKGSLVYSKIIYDDNNSLWGYFYLYNIDNLGDSTKMEYVVLDKNLNKITNGTYNVVKYKGNFFNEYITKYENCHLVGDKLILDMTVQIYNQNNIANIHNSHLSISLTDNAVSDEYILVKDSFVVVPPKPLKLTNRLDSLGNSILVDPIQGGGRSGFIVRKMGPYSRANIIDIRYFNEKRELIWKYKLDTIPITKIDIYLKTYNSVNYLFMDSTKIFFSEKAVINGKFHSTKVIALDVNTGQRVKELEIENNKSEKYHSVRYKLLGDTIAMFGSYYYNPSLNKGRRIRGFFRILIDKDLNEIEKKYVTFKDISTPEIRISEKSRINDSKNIYLSWQSNLMLNNGAVTLLGHEYNGRPIALSLLSFFSWGILNFDKAYSKDLFYINLDKNFELSSSQRVEMNKDYSENSLLFMQYHDNGMAAIVCHSNKKGKEHNNEYELVINTIKNNTLHTERIPITSKKNYVIIPRPAKDGYIMLNEYNTNEKYNQIRLEKLNY